MGLSTRKLLHVSPVPMNNRANYRKNGLHSECETKSRRTSIEPTLVSVYRQSKGRMSFEEYCWLLPTACLR